MNDEVTMSTDLVPHEREVWNAVSNQLSSEIGLASDFLAFGCGAFRACDVSAGRLPKDTVATAAALFVKACLSFRSVIHLCALGLERSAVPVNRSLFENSLNLIFLLRRRISLYQFNDSKVKPKTPLSLFNRRLTPAFRTALYNAWCILKDEKNVEKWTLTPNLKRAGKRLAKRLSSLGRPYVSTIGADWEKRIRKANSCVGLSLADFAASLGAELRVWYAVVYGPQSNNVHQSDATTYLNVVASATVNSFSPRWFTSPREIKTELHKAANLYLICVEEMHRRFGFGGAAARKIHDFATALKLWKLNS